jgi:hypothetical protein
LSVEVLAYGTNGETWALAERSALVSAVGSGSTCRTTRSASGRPPK